MTNDEAATPPDASPTPPVEESRSSFGRSALRFLRDVLVIVVVAVLVSFLIKTFLIRSFYIPSESMEATLQENDRIIVNQLQPRFWDIERGDVVVFRDPGGWLGSSPESKPWSIDQAGEWLLSLIGLAAPDSEEHLIKRVIGLPGDHVECCDEYDRILINGIPIDEPYLQLSGGTPQAQRGEFDVTVPADSLWVLGDNRNRSADSRYNQDEPGKGFVPIDHVVGRAVVISWPISRWTWLDNYSIVFSGADAARAEAGAGD